MTTVEPRFDQVVHAPPRLQVCGLLAAVDSMDFAAVRDAGATVAVAGGAIYNAPNPTTAAQQLKKHAA